MGTLILVSRRRHAELWWDRARGWSIVDERLTRALDDEQVRRQFGDEPFDRLAADASADAAPRFAGLVSRRTVAAARTAGWHVSEDADARFVAQSGPRELIVETAPHDWVRVRLRDAQRERVAEGPDLAAVEAVARAWLSGTPVPDDARDSVYWQEEPDAEAAGGKGDRHG